MAGQSKITELMDRVASGDPEAAQTIVEIYFEKLAARANAELGPRHRQASDGEDIALSALNVFLDGMAKGAFPRLTNRHDLRRLLVTITLRKAQEQLRHEYRQKRGQGRVRTESAFVPTGAASEVPGIAGVASGIGAEREPSPEEVFAFQEERERLLAEFPEGKLRQTVLLLMEGFDKHEIAEKMECSVRSVERRISDIGDLLAQHTKPSSDGPPIA